MAKELEFIEFLRLIRRNIKNLLSSKRELTEKEQLELLKASLKDEQRLLDIKAIRTSGDYVPNYNRPKKYTEYKIAIIEEGVEKFISAETKTAYERPIDFIGKDGSTVNALPIWLNHIKEEHLRVVEKKKIRLEQEEKNKETNYQIIMSKLMKVN